MGALIWTTQDHEAIHRQTVLGKIPDFKDEEVKLPRNIADAHKVIARLQSDRAALINAYISLYNVANEERTDREIPYDEDSGEAWIEARTGQRYE
jgi:hypothetical protein